MEIDTLPGKYGLIQGKITVMSKETVKSRLMIASLNTLNAMASDSITAYVQKIALVDLTVSKTE